jgi:hypothetical protein
MKTLSLLTTSSLLAAMLLTGCGSDSASSTSSTTLTSGQLVDAYLDNIDYSCADGKIAQTDVNGSFSCETLPVAFRLGGLKLGTIATIAADAQVFPQDLLSVPRAEVNNSDVVAMARFLQSCDENNNTSDGIKVATLIKESLSQEVDFNASDIDAYATEANITLIDEADALEHLTNTTDFIDAVNATENLPATVIAALLTPKSTLTQEVKDTLAYMGNEERLAYDVYNKLYETYQLKQFTNIATKSEYKHIQTVQLLVKKYISDPSEFTNIDLTDLNYKETKIEDMQAGTYDIQVIQGLYDLLISKGLQSRQDALEVGCMVEVTDINDLLGDIELAKESHATDVVTAFEYLRDGSYNHYWAFDKGLKNIGVAEGCCVLGTEYCHPDYPQK